MRVIVAKPEEPQEVRNFSGDLASLQACAGCTLEQFAREGHVVFWANSENRTNGMEFNRAVRMSDGALYGVFGPLTLTGTGETGAFESLTDEDLARWVPRLRRPYT